jgi:plastocyanin
MRRKRSGVFLLSAMAIGCGSEERSEKPAAAPGPPAQKTPSSVAAPTPSGTGTLTGIVVFDGAEVPEETKIPILTDTPYCEKHGHAGHYPAEDYVIDPKTRGIRNVIVYLDSKELRAWPTPPRQDVVIDNRNCRFEPHVNVSTVGSSVEVRNSDDVYHTTHLYHGSVSVFNPGLKSKGDAERTVLNQPGNYIVKCDRHGWMTAFLRVDRHPFHIVTSDQGRFTIREIPAGSYKVGMVHERLRFSVWDPEAVDVTIKPGETVEIKLKLGFSAPVSK